ncbi:MAG: iron-containing alcohol dehydrogenase, partial [candidate division KSB1 bacterium]|nr:iron-containing alcohol dehydrogenase [candidate division KSB1 bacterium]
SYFLNTVILLPTARDTMKNFEFYSAGRIIFGSGSFTNIGEVAAPYGHKALIVLGGGSLRKQGLVDVLIEKLITARVDFVFYEGIDREPEVEMVDRGVEMAKQNRCQLIIAVGGGSVIDTGKAISGLVTNGGSVLDYLEGVGKGAVISRPALPFIAVPTTAGTGAEVTKNAVICSRKDKFKKSIRSPYLIPEVALVDPELTVSLPPRQTAYSGMDALTQCIEAYVCKNSQPLTDALALYGIKLASQSLVEAYRNGDNLKAREEMALCSLLSGLALANAGLGAVHGIGAALGAHFNIPHGLVCAVLLPIVMEANYPYAMTKYAEVGQALTGKTYSSAEAAAKAGIDFIRRLVQEIGIPSSLSELGIKEKDIPVLVRNSVGPSMSANPRTFSEEELTNLLMAWLLPSL